MTKILLTGATGYIGSHTWLALVDAGFEVVGVDDFSNSAPAVLPRIARLSGREPVFERLDVGDTAALSALVARERIDAAVHFAASKAVGESMEQPLAYFRNNLGGLISTAQALQANGVHCFVFSSSATVYGTPEALPIPESAPLSTANPYGLTKLHGEQLLRELERCDPRWRIAYLRYFNPVGAHESGDIGEDPRGTPNNLMPYVAQVAIGRRERLQVFGGDYPTPDGTGVRDYVHVMDLAEGHVAALRRLLDGADSMTVNLGTGRGHSVLEVVRAYERASGRRVPYDIAPRRPGDVAACYADVGLAARLLGWRARRDLAAMCEDSWRWQSKNPQGYA
ncbi:UDP-glucose 4-epimerase GalE [Caldimonas sp. KR1-144]|uniref:UDP-glucose 4-epimerase GalE n=1 Tax=Caldimonas sp. KR1-144 TaxID=3400911 RepID=UPI003C120AA7